MRAEYAEKILSKAIWANGKYEGVYPLLSALSRPLISKHLVDIAHQYGAKYIAHGCTGKGNDQVRFETCIRALDPELEIIAPVREWDLTTRDSEMEWAEANGVPVPTTKSPCPPPRRSPTPSTTTSGVARSSAACSRTPGTSRPRTSGR